MSRTLQHIALSNNNNIDFCRLTRLRVPEAWLAQEKKGGGEWGGKVSPLPWQTCSKTPVIPVKWRLKRWCCAQGKLQLPDWGHQVGKPPNTSQGENRTFTTCWSHIDLLKFQNASVGCPVKPYFTGSLLYENASHSLHCLYILNFVEPNEKEGDVKDFQREGI